MATFFVTQRNTACRRNFPAECETLDSVYKMAEANSPVSQHSNHGNASQRKLRQNKDDNVCTTSSREQQIFVEQISGDNMFRAGKT